MNSNRSNHNNNKEIKRISLIPSRIEEPEYKYLPPIKHQQELTDGKWQEFKIDGKNIEHRAYATICILNDYLYLYGGYQISTGIMGDFYKMNLKAPTFSWEKIMLKDTPGPRTRHGMCALGCQILIFGGQVQQQQSTNSMWTYDVNLRQWTRIKVNSTYPPEVDNFGCILYQDNWYIFGGFFGGQISLHSNYVYKYSIYQNEWKHLQHTGSAPTPREGCATSAFNDNLFIFGGSNGHQRFNDLWQFDLTKCSFTYIPVNQKNLPRVRSGHSLIQYQQRLILFGGIHDITWELDDLYAFNLPNMEWELVDEDSSRRKENQMLLNVPPDPSQRPSKQNFRRSRRKTTRSSSIRKTQKRPLLSPGRDQSEDSIESPTRNLSLAQSAQKTLDEKKRKLQQLKKTAMLKLFEVDDGEKVKFKDQSPTSEAMRNAILLIGNPKSDLKVREGKLTEFGKPLVSKFLQPLHTMQNTLIGKKPCARDGHSVVIYGEQMIIFGGDRHKMSFNDIHSLDLTKL